MSEKRTRTVSLDPENDECLSKEDNASAVVNDLVEQYRQGADRDTVAIELQIKQKRREKELAENRVSRLTEDIEELQSLKQEFEVDEQAELDEAKDALENVPADPTNPAIKNWANKLGVSPQELIDTLELD